MNSENEDIIDSENIDDNLIIKYENNNITSRKKNKISNNNPSGSPSIGSLRSLEDGYNDSIVFQQYQMSHEKYLELVRFHSDIFWFTFIVLILSGILLGIFLYETWILDVLIIEKGYIKYIITPIYIVIWILLIIFRKDPKLTLFTLMLAIFSVGYLFGLITTLMFTCNLT
jgi:hypothetical protein